MKGNISAGPGDINSLSTCYYNFALIAQLRTSAQFPVSVNLRPVPLKHEAKKESPTQFVVSSVIFFALAIPLFGLFALLTSLTSPFFGTSPG